MGNRMVSMVIALAPLSAPAPLFSVLFLLELHETTKEEKHCRPPHPPQLLPPPGVALSGRRYVAARRTFSALGIFNRLVAGTQRLL